VTDLPDPPKGGFKSIDEALGQTINVAEVFEMRDGTLAVVTTSGVSYLCDNDWASQGATHIQGLLASSNADFYRARIVQEDDYVGFRPVEQPSGGGDGE
jgi:hypothetical protein